MEDKIPLPPDTAWGTKIRLLMKARCCDFEEAFAYVMQQYLNEGHTHPLIDLLQRRIEPGEAATRYVAAMIDPNFRDRLLNAEIRYQIQFDENRKQSGRPRKNEASKYRGVWVILMAGVIRITSGRKPGKQFWNYLREALAVGICPNLDFPLKAKLVRIDGRKGRRRDPELEIRNIILAWFALERIDRGDGYDSAIKDTLDMIKGDAAKEGWVGKLGEKTIRDAYDGRNARGDGRK